jgi:hypothetical protein
MQFTDTASAGNGGVATASANGGAVSIGASFSLHILAVKIPRVPLQGGLARIFLAGFMPACTNSARFDVTSDDGS